MSHTETVLNWCGLVLTSVLMVHNLATLVSRSGTRRTQSLLGRCWLGLFFLIETIPRVAGWQSGVVLALSVLGLLPLLLAVRMLRAR